MKDISLESLRGMKKVRICLENVECFDFQPSDFLVFSLVDLQDRKKGVYYAGAGKIIVKKSALKTLSSNAASYQENNEDIATFDNNMLHYCNIDAITLYDENDNEIEFLVEYDPVIHWGNTGEVLEFSNCPSAEIDVDGNMVLLFGSQSKQPRHVDNDYFNVIEGLSAEFELPQGEQLKIQPVESKMFHVEGGELWYAVELKVKNKNAKFKNNRSKIIHLLFEGVENLGVFVNKYYLSESELYLVRLQEGKIFVSLEQEWFNFICRKISVCDGSYIYM